MTDNQGPTGTIPQTMTIGRRRTQLPPRSSRRAERTSPAPFDGGGSSDLDGSVASYAWDFGDRHDRRPGANPPHTYAAAGTYTVALTVTDNDGHTGTVTLRRHRRGRGAPAAVCVLHGFERLESHVRRSTGSGSNDVDGTIASLHVELRRQCNRDRPDAATHLHRRRHLHRRPDREGRQGGDGRREQAGVAGGGPEPEADRRLHAHPERADRGRRRQRVERSGRVGRRLGLDVRRRDVGRRQRPRTTPTARAAATRSR